MTHPQSLSQRGFLLAAIGQGPPQNKRSHLGENISLHQQLKEIPPIHSEYWTFTVVGPNSAPLILSYQDTLALPATDVTSTLVCSNQVVPRRANTHWRGVPIQTLLDRFNIRTAFARCVAVDGYTTSLPLTDLSNAVLVYQMNGETLSHEDGFPARLVVPGYYGYKMPKWITRLELTDIPPTGYWEARGWPDSGRIATKAVILSPQNWQTVHGVVTIRGIAYAGEQGFTLIEANIDDGPWMPVPVPLAPPFYVTEWEVDWSPPAPGDYLLKVRARDHTSSTEMLASHQVVITILEV